MQDTLKQQHLNRVVWLTNHMRTSLQGFDMHYTYKNIGHALVKLDEISKALAELRQSLMVLENLTPPTE